MVHEHNHPFHGARNSTLKLAPGIELSSDGEPSSAVMLVLTAGKVHLNQYALAILELCDGSRSLDRVVVDAMLRSPGSLRAADVVAFLEAAQARGWVVQSV